MLKKSWPGTAVAKSFSVGETEKRNSSGAGVLGQAIALRNRRSGDSSGGFRSFKQSGVFLAKPDEKSVNHEGRNVAKHHVWHLRGCCLSACLD